MRDFGIRDRFRIYIPLPHFCRIGGIVNFVSAAQSNDLLQGENVWQGNATPHSDSRTQAFS
jgi:hypothetical protein